MLFRSILITALIMVAGCRKEHADLLCYNGVIYTLDAEFTVAEAMVVKAGKIVGTGTAGDLRKRYKIAAERDLLGNPVFPGFIDSHCHFFGYGQSLRQADLSGTRSVREVIARLKKQQEDYPSQWILGRGWDQNNWEKKEFPDRHMLDKAFADIPVYLTRVDGHAAWVNTKALTISAIQPGTVIDGGEILNDAGGLKGILLDNAMALVEKHIPQADRQEKIRALQAAERNCFKAGLTTVCDAGLDKDIVMLIDSLQRAGQLKMKVYAMLNPNRANLEHFVDHGIYRTGKLSVRSVKLFADGALGSRGALLIEPYNDDQGNTGIQVSTAAYLKQICQMAYEKGYQVNTHCIGDSAVRLMLNIYSSILPEHNDLRWRIEHSQVVHPDDLPKFVQYGIVPSVQTTHATSDMDWAGERLGSDRLKTAYAYRTLLALNGWLPNGSDFPVESINPLYGFYAAISRKDLQGNPSEGFQMQEALSRKQALLAMTVWAARACFEETATGSLEPGKSADFVVLDKDIMLINEAVIPRVRILETFVDGEKVYTINNE
jgi:predicted amidohydrolase YtcJ